MKMWSGVILLIEVCSATLAQASPPKPSPSLEQTAWMEMKATKAPTKK